MFAENSKRPHDWGSIEVITGCMFSGKTEELIRRVRRAIIARQKVKIFKSALDKRYSPEDVVSHDANTIRSFPVTDPNDILLSAHNFDVIGIDEAQFFDISLIDVCNKLANQGKRVIVAGLDLDFLGNPFGPMPALISIAEFVTKVHAICVCCGNLAHYSFRTAIDKSQIMLGSEETYQPLCRNCFLEAMKGTKS
jgi:thymidine kinase